MGKFVMGKKQSKAFRDLQNLQPVEKKGKIKVSRKESFSLNRFAEELQQKHPDMILVKNKGDIKISEVIWAFLDPEKEIIEEDLEIANRLVGITIIAWNLSLFPEDIRKEKINEFLMSTGIADDPLEANSFKEFLQIFIDRKLEYFSEFKHFIADFKLEDRGNTIHLSVAATIPDNDMTDDLL